MLELHVQKRGSGKTTEVIRKLREDEQIVAVVHSQRIKDLAYPEDVKDRVYTAKNFMHVLYGIGTEGYRDINYINRVVIDEGLFPPKDFLAQLYYMMGIRNLDAEVYGSYENIEQKENKEG